MSELTNLSVKLEDAQERVKSAQQLVEGDLQLAAEVSFLYLSLTSESLVGCHGMLVFMGSKGDVIPQVPLPPDGARPGG